MKSSIKEAIKMVQSQDFTTPKYTWKLAYCPHGQCRAFQVNNIVFLKSYDTLVAFYDEDSKQFYIDGLYSTTTRRHINAFLREWASIWSFVPFKKYIGKALINSYTREIEEIKGVD